MKSTYIDQIKSQAVVQDFFLVKSIAFKVGKNGKEYLDMTVGDKTGEVSCKKWEIGDDLDVLKSIDERYNQIESFCWRMERFKTAEHY